MHAAEMCRFMFTRGVSVVILTPIDLATSNADFALSFSFDSDAVKPRRKRL